MSHTIFVTPSSVLPGDINDLATFCKNNLLSYLYVRIVDEDLRPNSANLVFQSKHRNWLSFPEPKIITITNGVSTLKFAPTHYSVNLAEGKATFVSATTDPVRADYYYFPFSDEQIGSLTLESMQEISALIYRPIDENKIPQDYRPTICKRLYTNLLKALLLEARDFFSVSVGGRNIDKSNIVDQINSIIDQNEKQVMSEINTLRNFNKTKRVLPSVETVKTITSNASIV